MICVSGGFDWSAAANCGRRAGPLIRDLLYRRRNQPFTDGDLAGLLAASTYCLGGPANALLGGLLIVTPELHFPEDTLPLEALLEHLEGLVDIVVANENLQTLS